MSITALLIPTFIGYICSVATYVANNYKIYWPHMKPATYVANNWVQHDFIGYICSHRAKTTNVAFIFGYICANSLNYNNST